MNYSLRSHFLTFSLSHLLVLAAFSSYAAPFSNKDSTEEKKSSLPTVSIAPGVLYFLGDVGYSHFDQPFLTKGGFQFELQKHTNSNFAFSLFLLSGKVSGDEQTADRQVNFLSSIIAEGIQLRYDFNSRKRSDQILTPYISVGVEYIAFHTKGDLKDANGSTYNYWNDGTIRNIAQNDANASQAKIIYRDYTYETDLSDANIDGLGKFRTSAIGFPIGIGVKFRLSGRCSMHFGTTLHFTTTDLIDGINSESTGARKGNAMNDKIIFAFVSFRYDFSAPREVPKKIKIKQDDKDFKNVDFDALDKQYPDQNGIPDSTRNVQLDADGKPIDSDGDGIPDYRDKEPHSAKGALVDLDGVTITDAMIEEKWRKDSLAALPAIVEYLHFKDKRESENRRNGGGEMQSDSTTHPSAASSSKGIPAQFQPLDLDHNGVISPAEICKEIDRFLDGKSSFTTKQFYDLIDFFFSQQ